MSTDDQHLHLQNDALKKAGCRKIFTDVAGGGKADRPGLAAATDYVREGDTIVVWRLDRFGRSLRDLIARMTELAERGVGFRSLQEHIDSTTASGKLIFHVFGALAEFERDLLRERTRAGINAARARGRRGGRPRALDQKQLAILQSLHKDPANSIRDICRTLSISRATFYRYAEAQRGG